MQHNRLNNLPPRTSERDQQAKALPVHERLLVDAVDFGSLLGVSRRQVHKWRTQNLLPAPVDIAGRVRWRVEELRDWLAAGCPDPEHWRWKPALRMSLDDEVQASRDQLERLQAAISAARAELQELHNV